MQLGLGIEHKHKILYNFHKRKHSLQRKMDLSYVGQTKQPSANTTAEDDNNTATNDATSNGNVESSSSPNIPQLVYQSTSTAIYRLNDRGIKVCVHPNPSEEQIFQLVHEHNISKFLPSTVRKRHVVDVKGFKGDPAIYFTWTRGKTLGEWLSKAKRRGAEVDLLVRLRAAIAIVETLHDFHEGGVVYNKLSPNNIVLDTFEGSYVASLIDLSEAIIYYNKDEDYTNKVREVDLTCLGLILNEVFGGEDDNGNALLPGGNGTSWEDQIQQQAQAQAQAQAAAATAAAAAAEGNDAEEERKEEPRTRKRGRRQTIEEENGLPMYLGTMISTLLYSGGGTTNSNSNNTASTSSTSTRARYESAREVLHDLRVIEKNPSIYLKPLILDDFLVRGRLRLPADAFYGRQSEEAMLLHALSSVTMLGGQPMLCSISGSPGTG